jgi:multidrug efflux system membrane fusion protein
MRLKSQYVFIIAVVGVLALFFIVRSLFSHGADDAQAKAKTAPPAVALPSVQVQLTPENVREISVVMRGRTEAVRSVVVRSETSGVVAATPVLQGTPVKQGQVLCRLAVDARQASLDQARAQLKSRQLSKDAAMQLAQKGYRSQTQVLQAQADLDAAQAAVRQAEIALKQVEIRAPFDGVFDHRDAQVGTYLSPGQPCGTVVDLNPMLVVADAPETEAGKLRVGASAQARLLSGQSLSGRVRFVAHDADPQTRTYHLEVEAANPGLSVRSGLSADLRVNAGRGPAHLVPVSALVLDSAGRQGVRYVQTDGRVAFSPVAVLEETPQGAWVSGLSGAVNVITVGQSFVADGQKVRVAQAR